MNSLQLAQIRAETPGCQYVLHLNNAGAALPTISTVERIKNYIDLEASIGGYEAARLKESEINEFYEQVARLINCLPTEIAFCENATRAWDMIFYSFKFKPGDRVITSDCEYGSNYLALLQQAKRQGISIEIIRNDDYGQLDIQHLRELVRQPTKLIAITHVPSQSGLVNPVVEVGQIARAHQIPYLLDATQSIGQLPVDSAEIGCDFLCATGRKFLRGPRGTGFLFIRNEMISQLEPPFIDLQAANWMAPDRYELKNSAQRFETWEQNLAGKLGLTAAISYALNLGLENIWQRVQVLAHKLRQQLASVSQVQLRDVGQLQCGIITFTLANINAEDIHAQLALQKINVSISYPEYAQLDFTHRGLPPLIRASIHYYNTEEEIMQFCHVLRSIIENS